MRFRQVYNVALNTSFHITMQFTETYWHIINYEVWMWLWRRVDSLY